MKLCLVLMGKTQAQQCHTFVANGLFVSKRGRPNIQPVTAGSCTKFKSPMKGTGLNCLSLWSAQTAQKRGQKIWSVPNGVLMQHLLCTLITKVTQELMTTTPWLVALTSYDCPIGLLIHLNAFPLSTKTRTANSPVGLQTPFHSHTLHFPTLRGFLNCSGLWNPQL